MWRLWLLAEHLNDPGAPADPRIVGALTASLIVSVVVNWEFWSTAFNLLMGVILWLLSDDKLVLVVALRWLMMMNF